MNVPLPFAVLVAVAGAVLMSGCGKRGSAIESGVRDQIIHIGNLSEPTDLDPQIITSHQDFHIVMALFEGLTQYHPKTSEPMAAGAESWETSADGLTWTFHLRRNAKWSNGEPLTAHDYVYAYHRILMPGLGAEYANMLFVLKNAEPLFTGKLSDPARLGVRAADDHTLVLTLERPVPFLLTMLCHSAWYPVHRDTIEKFGRMDQRGSAWTRPGNLVSNGYMTLAEWKPHQAIRLVKNESYWDRENVRLNGAVFYPIESTDAEERTFRSGQLHVTSSIPISKIAVYKQENSPFLQQHVLLATYVYRFNVTVPPLNDPRVRRALAMAIDRETLVREVTKGGQLPAGHFCPPDLAGFTARAQVRTDIEGARKLLAEAGFPDGKGFPKLDILFNTNEAHRIIAEAIQQMWRRHLGIDIGLYNQEGKVWNDSMRVLDYQIARFAWVGDYLDPSTFLDIMTGDNGNNQTGWKNAEYDRLIAEAHNTADTEKRYALYQRCEQILAEECPIAPIYFYVNSNLRRPEVKGWYGNILDNHPLKGVYLEASNGGTN